MVSNKETKMAASECGGDAISQRRRSVLKAGFAMPFATTAGATIAMSGCAAMGARSNDATALSAVEAVRQIKDGSLSAESYASQLLARHDSAPPINAVSWIDKQQVLESARNVDLMRKKGQTLGPLAGLPVAIKDNIDTVGFPSTGGTPSLKANFPKQNAPFVDMLFSNGAYLFCKTHMHEMAKGGTSNNVAFGAVRNPFDLKRVPGGSSGGSAAALAARIVPVALGTDTAGSVRIPASLCGVVGFRPSTNGRRKLYSADGVLPLAIEFDTIGPMARNMGDIALIHSVATASAPVRAISLKGMRIGVPRAFFYDDLQPEVSRITEQALLKLRDAGVVLVEVDLGEYARSATKMFLGAMNIAARADLEEYLASRPTKLKMSDIIEGIRSPDIKTSYQVITPDTVVKDTLSQLHKVTQPRLNQIYTEALKAKGINFIVLPTEPIVAPLIKVGGDSDGSGKRDPEIMKLIRNTCITAVVGAPAVSIPAGLTAQGLPVGLEFDGINGADGALLSLALAAEKALGA
jgi:Asp-tRNA(Asn)/Glu-tRNA(Gln) amidotransferase A subunit family amidase